MSYLDASPVSILFSVCAFLVWFVLNAAIGVAPVRRIEIEGNFVLSNLERFVFASGLGWIATSLFILIAGSLGYLNAAVLWGAAAIAAFFSARGVLNPEKIRSALQNIVWSRWVLASLVVTALALVPCLFPEIGNDALAYHLEHPRQFILQGHIGYVPHTRESLWPYLSEMHFTLALLTAGVPMAKMVHWGFYVLTACAVYAMGARWAGPGGGWKSAWIWLLTPVAFSQAGYAYVDLASAFFTTLALFPLVLPSTYRKDGHAILSGIGCAGALGTKYLALGLLGILALYWCWESRKNLKPVLYFAVTVAALSGVWYLRSWILLGNPVYPFMHSYFGNHGVQSELGLDTGKGAGIAAFLRLVWDMTFYPGPFGGDIVGPLLLLFLPGVLLYSKLRKLPGSTLLLLVTVAYMAFVFMQARRGRFFLHWIPIMSVYAGMVWCEMGKRSTALRVLAGAAVISVSVLHLGILAHRTRPAYDYVRMDLDARTFLRKYERSFLGNEFLEKNSVPGQKIFNAGERRRFYGPDREIEYLNEFFVQSLVKQGLTLSDYLEKQKFDYIWVNKFSLPDVGPYLKQSGYEQVYAYDFTEMDATYSNQIYRKP